MDSYTNYITKQSDGAFVSLAKTQLKKIDYTICKTNNSIALFEEYLKKYDSSPNLDAMKSRLEYLYISKAFKTTDTSEFRKYLIRYPSGEYVPTAKKQIENICFKEAWNDTIVSPKLQYLMRYPDGRYTSFISKTIETEKDKYETDIYNFAKEGKLKEIDIYLSLYAAEQEKYAEHVKELSAIKDYLENQN